MKKILILLTIIPIMLFSSLNIEKVTKTLSNIKKGKKTISFFNANQKISLGSRLNVTSLTNADIVLSSSKKYQSKITIVNAYKKLKSNKNSIGAIYLKKGRTQIVFIKERLDGHGLTLSSKFKKHIIHEWQLSAKSLLHNLK